MGGAQKISVESGSSRGWASHTHTHTHTAHSLKDRVFKGTGKEVVGSSQALSMDGWMKIRRREKKKNAINAAVLSRSP